MKLKDELYVEEDEGWMKCMLRLDEGLRKSPFQEMDFPGEKSISRNGFFMKKKHSKKCIFHRKSSFQKMHF